MRAYSTEIRSSAPPECYANDANTSQGRNAFTRSGDTAHAALGGQPV